MEAIGVRAGGGRGGLQPPQSLGNSDFLGIYYYYILKTQIFSILTKEVGVIIQLRSHEGVVA